MNNSNVEETYLEAEADIRNNNFHEAYQKLESILYEEPDFAPAHNSMGWVYKNQFDNYDKALNHFRAALNADPYYPHPYFHIAVILTDQERFEDLEKHLESCVDITTIDKSWVFDKYAMMYELQGQYAKAIQFYEKAILSTMSNEKVTEFQGDINRCNVKANIARHKKPWLKFW